MAKADGDTRKQDLAAPARGQAAANPSPVEAPNVKPAAPDAQTVQDDIPPVHVLEAAQNQDRKETEDLLAGFDRPGRSPKPAPRERDFVGYYAKKKNPGVPSGAGQPVAGGGAAAAMNAGPKQADVATMVVPRKREGTPLWMAWVAAAAFMLAIGGMVAYLATGEPAPNAVAPTGPSAATTITAATPVPQNTFDNIPPPAPVDPNATSTANTLIVADPAVPTNTTAPPKSSGRRGDPKSVPSSAAGAAATATPHATSATDDGKPPPRDDFIRDL